MGTAAGQSSRKQGYQKKRYNDYYSALGQYKLTLKELEKARAIMDSYDEFLSSRCEMIILICDFSYVEIYCKNQSWIQFLLNESKKIDRSTISEKYEDTDERTEMYV